VRIGLLLAAYGFIVLGLRVRGSGWRAAAIGAATIWGIVVVLITELLSIPRELTRSSLAVAWLLADAAALVYLLLVARQKLQLRSFRALCAAYRQTLPRPTLASTMLVSGVGIVVVLVAMTALLSPPNTWDVMAYHMPRVVAWIQNRTVAFYATPYLPELRWPPWAEFAIFHLHVLFGGDRFDNLVQWCSFLGSVVGVTLLAQLMGAGSRGQVLAAVLCATIPQGILEASGAKNDYVVAFWLVAFVYYLFAFKREPTLANAFAIGGALGLAWLTKSTAHVFSLAILLAAGLAWPWEAKVALLKRLPLVVVFALALNAGHFVRNYGLYGSPLGPSTDSSSSTLKYTNDEITVSTLFSNILRNVSIHMGTPIRAVNLTVEKGIEALIHAMGDDPNNPRTTWSGTLFHVPEMSRHEALAGNPLHLMLIMLALGLMLSWRHLRMTSDLVISAVGLVLAFLLFCALLRWLPWHSRLHLPLFVLWSAAVGTILTRVWRPSVTTGLGIFMLLLSVPVVLSNQLRPLAFAGEFSILRQERRTLYFAENRELMNVYRLAAEFVKEHGCEAIGLDLPPDSPTYPLLIFLEADQGKRHVQYVGVTNPSARYSENETRFMPCAVICVHCSMIAEKWKAYLSKVGPATVFQQIVVYSAKGTFPFVGSSTLQSPECTLTFMSGWHGWERGERGWWRWTDGRGEIRLYTDQDSDLVMYGEVYSVQRPNKADVFVNGKKVMTWDITGNAFKPFELAELHFKAGENRLVFASHNPAIQIHTDSRELALAVQNLLVAGADGATICELQP
jgi:Dolichyl-phosphate-mannose-protein mannosyltransferase